MARAALRGGCHCANVGVTVELSSDPNGYHPRACDCEFCRKHGAVWVSDAHGSLLVRIADPQEVSRYVQGDGIAEMLVCRRCGVLVAALWAGPTVYGVVNVKVLDEHGEFASTEPVSPRQLSAEAKTRRWQAIWFAAVTVVSGKSTGAQLRR